MVMAIFTFLLGGFIAPLAKHQGDILKAVSTGNNNTVILGNGENIWTVTNNGFINIDKSEPGNILSGFSNFIIKDNQLVSYTYADKAQYNSYTMAWSMNNVSILNFKQDSIDITEHSHQVSKIDIPPKVINYTIL